jgi:hypothetical protein
MQNVLKGWGTLEAGVKGKYRLRENQPQGELDPAFIGTGKAYDHTASASATKTNKITHADLPTPSADQFAWGGLVEEEPFDLAQTDLEEDETASQCWSELPYSMLEGGLDEWAYLCSLSEDAYNPEPVHAVATHADPFVPKRQNAPAVNRR